ncbi:retropepsin-like aspartic protease [Flavobacterium sp.]
MKIKLVITLFLTFFFTFSQNVNFDKGNIVGKKYFEEISVELVHQKIIVPVIINGKTYQFLLDTGAPNIISKKVFDELNLQQAGTVKTSDANNLKQIIKATEIPSMQIGNLVFENQVALVYDLDNHNVLSCFGIDGFIGSNLLRNSVIKISKKDKKIIISNDVKKLNPQKKPTKIKLVGSQKAPYIQFDFLENNKVVVSDLVLIDTGMDGIYEMSNRAYNKFKHLKAFEVMGKSIGTSGVGLFGSGNSNEHTLFKVDSGKLNNTLVSNLVINTTDDNNSRIGLDFLEYGDLIIDFKRKKSYFKFESTVALTEKAPKYNSTVIEGKYVIGFVWDKKCAETMNFGDEIISVDENKISEMDICQLLALKQILKDKTSYNLKIKNKENQIHTILIQN